MIIQLQESLKKYGLKVILWLILISMAAGYLAVFLQKDGGVAVGEPVAYVNDEPISQTAYNNALAIQQERFNFFKARFGAQAENFLAMLGLKNPQEESLNNLISNKLLERMANSLGIVVDPLYALSMLSDPQALSSIIIDILPLSVINPAQGSVDQNALRNYLKTTHQSPQHLQQSLLAKIKASIVENIIETAVSVVPGQIDQALAEQYQPRSYDFFMLQAQDYVAQAQQTQVSTQELENFFNQENKKSKRYWQPESRVGTLVTFEDKNWGAAPTPAAIENFYKNHKALYVQTPAQLEVRHILLKSSEQDSQEAQQEVQAQAHKLAEQLQADPTSFEALAQHYSQDSATAAQGGLLPVFSKGTHDPLFERAALSIKADGAIAGPIKTAQGWQLVQRVKRSAVAYKPLADVAESIAQRLLQQDFKANFSSQATRLLAGTQQKQEAIDAFIQDKKGSIGQSTLFEKNTQGLAAKRLFGLSEGRWGFFIEANRAYLVHCDTVNRSHPASFEAITKSVEHDYYQAQADQAFNKAKKSIAARLESSRNRMSQADFQQLAKASNATLQHSPMVIPSEDKGSDALQKLGINLNDLRSLSTQDSTLLFDRDKKLVVCRVHETQPVTQELAEAKRPEVAAQLYQQMRSTAVKGFVASLYRNATINIVKAIGQ